MTKPVFLAEHPLCQVRIRKPDTSEPPCTMASTQIHHAKGREGKLLNDTRFFVAWCHNCHQHVERHGQWAKLHGFKLQRHSTTN